jgi:heme/copper-type cytochrome/quinol oxidase subunit 2
VVQTGTGRQSQQKQWEGSVRGTTCTTTTVVVIIIIIIIIVIIIIIKGRNFAAVKFPRQYPLVLLVQVVWKQSKALGSQEGNVMGSGLLAVCSRGKK